LSCPDPHYAARWTGIVGLFAGNLHVVVDFLTGLLCQFKPDRPLGLFCLNRCPLNRVLIRCNIVHFDSDDIAAAQLAVDRQIEQSQVARFTLDLQLRTGWPDMLWPERRLGSDQLEAGPAEAGPLSSAAAPLRFIIARTAKTTNGIRDGRWRLS
jgi:hypothetical protein